MADLERQASVLANLTGHLVSEPKKLAAVAVLRTAAGLTTGGSGSTRESQRPGSRCCLWCWSAPRSAGRNKARGTPAVRTDGGRRSGRRPATPCLTASPGRWSGPESP